MGAVVLGGGSSITASILRECSRRIAEGMKTSGVTVFAYPSRRAVHAALILASVISFKGGMIEVRVSLDPHPTNEELSVLVGYGESSSRVGGLAAFDQRVVTIPQDQPEPVSSLQICEEMTFLDGERRITGLSSVFQEGRRISENDPALSILESSETVSVLKKFLVFYGCEYRPLAESMHLTLHPFLPNFTGKPLSQIAERLRSIGVEPDKPVTSQAQDPLKKLLEEVLNELKKASRVSRSSSELVSPQPTVVVGGVKVDLREVAAAVDVTLDMNPGLLLCHYSGMVPLSLVLSRYYESLPVLASCVERILDNAHLRRVGRLIIIKNMECDVPLTKLSDVLRELGVLGKDEVLAVEREGRVITTIYEIGRSGEGVKEFSQRLRQLRFPHVEVKLS